MCPLFRGTTFVSLTTLNMFSVVLQGEGSEARRAEAGVGFLGEGAASSPSRVLGEAAAEIDLGTFSTP